MLGRYLMNLPGLFLDVFHDIDALVCDFREFVAIRLLQLFQDDGSFVAIWGAEGEELDALGGDETGWIRHFGFLFCLLLRLRGVVVL